MTITSDTPPDSQPLILRTDTCGRVLLPAERRGAILEEFERSGHGRTGILQGEGGPLCRLPAGLAS